jgi:hypothetical protein
MTTGKGRARRLAELSDKLGHHLARYEQGRPVAWLFGIQPDQKKGQLGQRPQPDKTCESWKNRSRSAKGGANHETKPARPALAAAQPAKIAGDSSGFARDTSQSKLTHLQRKNSSKGPNGARSGPVPDSLPTRSMKGRPFCYSWLRRAPWHRVALESARATSCSGYARGVCWGALRRQPVMPAAVPAEP